MKITTITVIASLIIFSAALTVTADIARPKTSPSPQGRVALHTSLTIEPDTKGYEAKLQIRQSDLQLLRAALDNAPSDRSVASTIAHSSTRTMIAGLMLFLSISFAGIWLARSKRIDSTVSRNQKVTAAILLVVATISAAAIVTRGNAGPPGYYSWRNLPKSLSEGNPTSGAIDIEIIPDAAVSGTAMKLIIPLRKQGGSGGEE